MYRRTRGCRADYMRSSYADVRRRRWTSSRTAEGDEARYCARAIVFAPGQKTHQTDRLAAPREHAREHGPPATARHTPIPSPRWHKQLSRNPSAADFTATPTVPVRKTFCYGLFRFRFFFPFRPPPPPRPALSLWQLFFFFFQVGPPRLYISAAVTALQYVNG